MTKFFLFHEPGLRPIRVHYSQTPEISRREFGLRVPVAFDYETQDTLWAVEEYLHTLPGIDLSVDVVLGKRAPGTIRVTDEIDGKAATIRLEDDGYPLAIALHIYLADAAPTFPTASMPAETRGVERAVVIRPPDVFFEAPGRKRYRLPSWNDLASYVGETIEEWV